MTKSEIVKHVWPSTVVEESNLRFQMLSLRKALGEDRDVIKTIPGRGYLFVAEVAVGEPRAPIATAPPITAAAVPSQYPAHGIEGASDALGETTKPTVAIIDDDCDTREALQGLLGSVGLEVESFGSVQAFLDTPRHSPPECLVLDMWLPGRSGLEFQVDLAKADIHSPVIFISGHADVHTCVQAMKAGAFDFLTKPVRHQELLAAVQLAIAPRLGKATHSSASASQS